MAYLFVIFCTDYSSFGRLGCDYDLPLISQKSSEGSFAKTHFDHFNCVDYLALKKSFMLFPATAYYPFDQFYRPADATMSDDLKSS